MPIDSGKPASLGPKSRPQRANLDLESSERMLVALQGKDEQWHSKPYTLVDLCAALSSRWLLSRCSSWVLPIWAITQGQAAPCKRTSRQSLQNNAIETGGRVAHCAAVISGSDSISSEKTTCMRRIAKVAFSTDTLGLVVSRARRIAVRIRRCITLDPPVLATLNNRQNHSTGRQSTQKIHHCLHKAVIPLFPHIFKVGAATC